MFNPLSTPKSAGHSCYNEKKYLVFWTSVAIGIGLFWRLIGYDRPLWADETFTGAISQQPKFSIFIEDCLNELSGPGYYGLMWVWQKFFGATNMSLRLPSFLFSILALLIVIWKGNFDRSVKLIWAAAIAVFHMSAYYAWEARAYSLLFLLSVTQVILFESLVRQPRWQPAYGWAAVSVFAAFTHYFTLPMTALQGLALVFGRWKYSRRYWPALLIFIPLTVWIRFHLAVLLRFSGEAWQPIVNKQTIVETVGLAVGSGRLVLISVILFALLMAATFAYDVWNRQVKNRPLPYDTADLLAVGAALGALSVIFVYGYLKHSFTPRYLMPVMPALLLAPASWAKRLAPLYPAVPTLLVMTLAGAGGALAGRDALRPLPDVRLNFEAQTASDALINAGVRRVVFLWDAPEAKIPTPSLVRRVNGFFFDRANTPIWTTSVILAKRTDDPDANVILPAILKATRRPGIRDGFVWMFVPTKSVASRHPVRFEELAKDFDCKKYGEPGFVTTLGCMSRVSP